MQKILMHDGKNLSPEYLRAVRQMSGTERLRNMTTLSEAIWQMIAIKLQTRHPNLSERELRRKVAEKLYQSDLRTLTLLRKVGS
jgi:CMP-2-keto-3-deoxyoctulosonic acid synthetase